MGRHKYSIELEPMEGLLTDEEIIKYAPNSCAASKVRSKKSNKITDKLKSNPSFREMWGE